ncbi:MAG: hypothetical protein KF821_09095 [Anaerolineales bacterium]|nr:hypothetical protein [Anaerolineales bacterium]
MSQEKRRWKCECGCVLGVVAQTPAKVRRLRILRLALPGDVSDAVLQDAEDDALVEAMGVAQVRCSHCDRKRSWHAAADGMRELMAKRGAQR